MPQWDLVCAGEQGLILPFSLLQRRPLKIGGGKGCFG